MKDKCMEIIAESIGLQKPTKVFCCDRVLVTQGLSIGTLVELWKWYYNMPPFKKIILKCDTKLFNSLHQKPLRSVKSCIEIFADNGVVCQELRKENDE